MNDPLNIGFFKMSKLINSRRYLEERGIEMRAQFHMLNVNNDGVPPNPDGSYTHRVLMDDGSGKDKKSWTNLDGVLISAKEFSYDEDSCISIILYHYNDKGLITEISTNNDNWIKFEYDEQDRKIKVSYPNGWLDFKYANNGMLFRAVDSNDNEARSEFFERNRIGQLEKWWRTDGAWAEWIYEENPSHRQLLRRTCSSDRIAMMFDKNPDKYTHGC